jgi:sporulation protein YlmC with PRC-barrel domain
MRLSDLLTLEVRGDSGWTFGRVHDVRVHRAPDGSATVTALLVGSAGLRERLTGRTNAESHTTREHGFEIPWAAVISVGSKTITIKEAQ